MIERVRARRPAGGVDAVPSRDVASPCGEAVADEDWRDACRVVEAIVAATTIEEFNRLAPGFGPAYRRLRDCAWKAKQDPSVGVSDPGTLTYFVPKEMAPDPDTPGGFVVVAWSPRRHISRDPALFEAVARLDALVLANP